MLYKLLISCLLLLSFNAFAEPPLSIGGTLLPIELNNQHGKVIKVGNDVKTIIFAVEKKASALINNFLIKQDAKFLTNKKAYFVADISGMPSMITKIFAIPKMKKRPYDILLAKQASKVAFIPRKKDYVTVIKIAAGKVKQINFINQADQLQKVL